MRSRKLVALFSALTIAASFLSACPAFAGAKRRVAILPFEYGAVTSQVGTVDVGKGITSLLITKLVNDGTYSVVERQILDQILKEQNLSVSDRADPSTACKIGKLLSVDAIVVGTVTQFGFENKNVNVGAAASAASSVASYIPYVGGFGGFGLGGASVRKGKCKVAIDARVVDVNTGEILAACHGTGESKRSSTSLFGGGGSGWSGGSGSFDMGSSEFESSIAGEATLQAVESVGGQVITTAAKIPDNQSLAAQNVEGKIADVTGTQVIVNVGKANGIVAGDNLQVDRTYKTVKDPDSGKVLKELSNTIAVITISTVDNDSSTGSIVRGAGVRVGDAVKKVSTEVSAILVQPIPGDTQAGVTPTPTRSLSTTGTILGDPGSKSPVNKIK